MKKKEKEEEKDKEKSSLSFSPSLPLSSFRKSRRHSLCPTPLLSSSSRATEDCCEGEGLCEATEQGCCDERPVACGGRPDGIFVCEEEAVLDGAEVGVEVAGAELGHVAKKIVEGRADVSVHGDDGGGEGETQSVEDVSLGVLWEKSGVLLTEILLVLCFLFLFLLLCQPENCPVSSSSWGETGFPQVDELRGGCGEDTYVDHNGLGQGGSNKSEITVLVPLPLPAFFERIGSMEKPLSCIAWFVHPLLQRHATKVFLSHFQLVCVVCVLLLLLLFFLPLPFFILLPQPLLMLLQLTFVHVRAEGTGIGKGVKRKIRVSSCVDCLFEGLLPDGCCSQFSVPDGLDHFHDLVVAESAVVMLGEDVRAAKIVVGISVICIPAAAVVVVVAVMKIVHRG